MSNVKPSRASSYHGRVAAADELPDLVKDAFTVDAFVHGAPLHDDGNSQQDLLANVLLETERTTQRTGPPSAGYQQDGEEQRCRAVVYPQLQLIVFGLFRMETVTSLPRLIKQKQTGTLLVCLFSSVTTARHKLG